MKGKIGYATGDPLELLKDAQLLKPTAFPAVPRILNRIYQSLATTAAEPNLKGYLLRTAIEAKLKNYRERGVLTHMLWDRLVFAKVCTVLFSG